jgi:hypothetical protein
MLSQASEIHFSVGTHRVFSLRHADSSTLWCGISSLKEVVGRAGFEPATLEITEYETQYNSRCKRDIIAGLDYRP